MLATWESKTLNETKNRITLRTGIAIIKHTGDLNGDKQITPADAAIALQIAASGAHDDAADVSGDGRVTSLDALMILQAAAGNIEDPITGCGNLDQTILRMYDVDEDGLIDANWAINAAIDLEYHRITQSGYDQVKYAYEHNCPVEPKSEGE